MIIGVTGGIGSGKSTVLRAVARQGYPVYDCDAEAKRLIVEDPTVRKQLAELFGPEVYNNGVYQTQLVAAQVFADPGKLARLNAIVHPAVTEDIRRWAADKDLAFIESAILVSSGMNSLCDALVAVTAPEAVRVQRVLHRAAEQGKPTTEAEVRARIRSQQAESGHPMHEINNDGTTPIDTLAQQLIHFAQSL